MERADRRFHDRVATAFALFATPAWQTAHAECGRIIAVSGSDDEAAVAAAVERVISEHVPELLATEARAR
jgi:hypothetical protein